MYEVRNTKYTYIPGFKLCTQDARFVYKRHISDARINNGKKDKYSKKWKSMEDPKFRKVLPNTDEVIYSWGKQKSLGILKVQSFVLNS